MASKSLFCQEAHDGLARKFCTECTRIVLGRKVPSFRSHINIPIEIYRLKALRTATPEAA
jgi:hypothetical protein